MLLESIALALAVIHFGIPTAYYAYLRRELNKPWNLRLDPSYLPRISIIVPTYNEAQFIEKKLDDIYSQDYPRDRVELIVIDSASTDDTPELVRKWSESHSDISLKLIVEPVRRGKAWALNEALKHVSSDSEIAIITDVDSWWPDRNTLRKVANLFADPIVGAVSCIKVPHSDGVESSYRSFYNTVRVGESKVWSTPIFHGELAAFRKRLLEEIGGFPTDIGADDSHTATKIVSMGHRAVIHEDVVCEELIPRSGYHRWRIRRAQHLIQHFIKVLRLRPKMPRKFKMVLRVETFLHLANPWLLTTATVLLIASALRGNLVALALLMLGAVLLAVKPYRTWILTQLYLVIAAIRNVWTKEIAWSKQAKSIN